MNALKTLSRALFFLFVLCFQLSLFWRKRNVRRSSSQSSPDSWPLFPFISFFPQFHSLILCWFGFEVDNLFIFAFYVVVLI
ncbi:hypothetical protein NC651_010552 [Populus alba x Populus x berolinensis]|nr:hypothetical protein NC651_010552 [Populus alba x Populus x berolinensis]